MPGCASIRMDSELYLETVGHMVLLSRQSKLSNSHVSDVLLGWKREKGIHIEGMISH